jgi:hypothetical protein
MSRDRLECLIEAIKNLILEENRHSDPPSAHYIPHDLAQWFVEAGERLLNGDVESLDRALGLLRSPGRPVDPNKSKHLDLAEMALTQKMQGKTWAEINTEAFADRAEPPDERHIRTLVDRYRPLIMEKWSEDCRRRWDEGSEARLKRIIEKNKRKGKSRTPNSG